MCPAEGADDPALRAALHRQEIAKTAYIEFKQVEVVVKGGVTDDVPVAALKPAKSVPEEETTLESRNRFIIDGEKVRYENNHPTWFLPAGKLQNRTLIAFSDGVTAKSFRPQGSDKSGSLGGIDKGPRQEVVRSSHVLAPITMALRGDDPAISPYLLSEAKLTGQASLLGGLSCPERVIEYPNEVRVTFLLDPEKGLFRF